MRFVPTPLVDAKLIELEPRRDSRGLFVRSWCQKEFKAAGIAFEAVQANLSLSTKAGTVRGLHFQRAPFAEPKIVRCVKGSVQEAIVDLRPLSLTYRQHFTIVLSEPGLSMVYAPAGFAQGIQTLADDTIVEYMMGEYYQPDVYDGVRHDDPAFGINWVLPVSEISEQDLAWGDWSLRDVTRPLAALQSRSVPVRDPALPMPRARSRSGFDGFVPPVERPLGAPASAG